MSMNYNDIEAPKFVDFGSNFDEDGEGDSWFSNDSVVINPDEEISFGDSFQDSGLASSAANIASSADTPVASSSTTPTLVAPPTSAFVPSTTPTSSTSTISLPGSSASSSNAASKTSTSSSAPPSTAVTPASGAVSKLVTRTEFEKNHKKVTQFAATPPQQKRSTNSSLERKNSRRRSLRKAGASLVRSARKAAIRARDKMTPKKQTAPKQASRSAGITNVEPFQLSTESRAKRVRQESTIAETRTPPPKKPARLRAKNVEPFSVSAKPTAASQAQRAAFMSSAEIQLKFSTKTPERFRTKRVAGPDKQKDNADEKIGRTILDPKILQSKGKLPAKNRQAATCPKSPAFALKNRKRRRPEEAETTEAKGSVDTSKGKGPAKTAAVSGLKSALKTESKAADGQRKNVTIPEPFECHTRSKEMMEHKEKVIEKVLDEEKAKREFHAQPLPDLSTAHVPPKRTIPATNPKPFHLMTDERGSSKEHDFENRVKEEEDHLKKLAEFKANPPKVLDQAPFVPKAPRKPLTEFKEFQLATNERADAWEENDAKKAEREAEMRAMDEEREKMIKLAEEKEIKRMREEMVHKAQPVPLYKPMEVHPSEKPVTIPESPNWSKKNSRNTSKL